MGGTGQQYCLRWNNHRANLLTVFEQLLNCEAFTDVTLACNGTSIKCHKIVLAACSPYFQSLFLENSCPHPIVVFKDIQYVELRSVLEYMYRGEVTIAQEQVSNVLKAAKALRVKGLYTEENEESSLASAVSFEPITPNLSNTGSSSTFLPVNGSITRTGLNQSTNSRICCPVASRHNSPVPPVSTSTPTPMPTSTQPSTPSAPSHTSGRQSSSSPDKPGSSDKEREGSMSSDTTPPEDDREDSLPTEPVADVKPIVSLQYVDIKGVPLPNLAAYVPKQKPELKRYRQYTRDDISAAIDAVKKGMSALQASRLYGVPSRTLYDKVRKLGIISSRPSYRRPISLTAHPLAQGGRPVGSPRDGEDSMEMPEEIRGFRSMGHVTPLEELGLYFGPGVAGELALRAGEERLLRNEPSSVSLDTSFSPIDLSQGYERMLRGDAETRTTAETTLVVAPTKDDAIREAREKGGEMIVEKTA